MSTPKISIIVPVYNVEKYLRRCLDSIVAQTFTDWECILVDDGSPDNSGKICDEYATKDNRFRVFHQENQGVSAARNKGLDEAKGEWIGFVDSDDWVEKDYIMAFSPNELVNGSLYVHSNYYKEKNSKNKTPGIDEKSISYCSDTSKAYMILERTGCVLNSPCLKLFQLSAIQHNSLKFDQNISLGEDYLFVLAYLSLPEIKNLFVKEYCGYHYIDNANSLVHRVISPKDSIYFSEEGYRLKNKVLKNFDIIDTEFTVFLLQESQSRLFNALHSNYLISSFSDEERKKNVENIKELNKKYKGKATYKFGKRNKLYRFILTYFPVNVINVLMKLIFKIKNHN